MADKLSPRIASGLATAQAWENADLLKKIRASIPFDVLVPEQQLPTDADDDETEDEGGTGIASAGEAQRGEKKDYTTPGDSKTYEGDDLLLKRLTLYFKRDVMTWMNSPPCASCGGTDVKSFGMRGPVTAEEREGGAGRVELYQCNACQSETTFPRYNNTAKLFESRKGRCGEFANLFGQYCRAAGFDTRYCSDFTDHVWVECWSNRQNRWIHADSCEGRIDCPNMYEQGWGKKLNYVLAFTHDSAADVTRRYTRKFASGDFQARRREYCPSESVGDMILAQVNASIRQRRGLPKGRADELDRRMRAEAAFFAASQERGTWDAQYTEGRISGSLAWRSARNELGDRRRKTEESKNETKIGGDDDSAKGIVTTFFHVESFHPCPHRNDVVSITIRHPSALSFRDGHGCIAVSGVPCAAGLPDAISIVVIDEASGCVLQSRSASDWVGASSFLHTVPDDRVVAVYAAGTQSRCGNKGVLQSLGRIGGLKLQSGEEEKDTEENASLLFVGQVNHYPDWTVCLQTADVSAGIHTTIEIPKPTKLKLQRAVDTVPGVIATRLPEAVMPLQTQLMANDSQKKIAFLKFIDDSNKSSSNKAAREDYVGFTTMQNLPVYLISSSGFPFRRAASGSNGLEKKVGGSWTTYHFLPEPLVAVDDSDLVSSERKLPAPKFDVPLDEPFFVNLLGPNLLVKTGETSTLLDTPSALANSRLVALYFSAHWCGPCRRFTPMLVEMYHHLKDVIPTHGLEIIFVSSDKDQQQFQHYYNTMPWLAVPYANGRMLQQTISSKYGVRGIPSLVVLDAMSGQVVVSKEQSRPDVGRACQGGDDAIESLIRNEWLAKIPAESKAIWESLELSCDDDAGGLGDSNEQVATNAYLTRTTPDDEDPPLEKALTSSDADSKDSAERIKEIFSQLVVDGADPNTAAAKAIQIVAEEQKSRAAAEMADSSSTLGRGTLSGKSDSAINPVKTASLEEMVLRAFDLNSGDKSKVKNVVSTSKKYLENARKDPTNPKFRSFRMSNKIFDRITATLGGIELLLRLGFSVYHDAGSDFMACIPLATNMDRMSDEMDRVLRMCENN